MKTNELIEIGVIGPAHGLQGAVFLVCHDRRSELNDYEFLLIDNLPRKIIRSYAVSQKLAVLIEGSKNRTDAESLRNKKVYVAKSAIEVSATEVLIADLVGCKTYCEFPEEGSRCLGVVRSVQNFGAQETLEIEYSEELRTSLPKVTDSSFYFPYLEGFVLENKILEKKLLLSYHPEFWSGM
jgi:16S rRNA processing protein RimM